MQGWCFDSWDKEVGRQEGEAFTDAAKELREREESQPPSDIAREFGRIGRMIQVFFPEDVDAKYADFLVEDENGEMIQISQTLKQVYPDMCPPEGKAHIYISDMDEEWDERVLAKTSEVFDSHRVLPIFLEAFQYADSYLIQRRIHIEYSS